jgi:hypothetical protein
MFGKGKTEKLPGPRDLPEIVRKHLVADKKMDAELVKFFKIVWRRRPETETALDCRIFDPSEAMANEVEIKNYTSFDEHLNLILYEGWFDEHTQHVELEEKKKVNYAVPIFTEAEIRQKIEALNEPGSSTFFYMARGAGYGGPLGQGAAIVELNPNVNGKKGKKYNIYTANVIDIEPAGNKRKLFDADKPKQVAEWIKQAHHQRLY